MSWFRYRDVNFLRMFIISDHVWKTYSLHIDEKRLNNSNHIISRIVNIYTLLYRVWVYSLQHISMQFLHWCNLLYISWSISANEVRKSEARWFIYDTNSLEGENLQMSICWVVLLSYFRRQYWSMTILSTKVHSDVGGLPSIIVCEDIMVWVKPSASEISGSFSLTNLSLSCPYLIASKSNLFSIFLIWWSLQVLARC